MAVLQSYSEPVRDTERLFEVFLRDQDGEIFREEIVSCDPKEERGAIELRAAEERADKYGVTVDWYMIAGSSDITHVPEKIRSLYDEKFDGSHEIHFDWKGKEFTILSANESMVRIKSPAGKISEIPRVSFMEEISVAENAKNAPKAKKDPQMNEVSCGECGKKFKHEVGYEGDLKCPHCGYEDEQCYFPDSDATECRICGNLVSDFQSESGDLCRDCASSNSPETQKNESGTTSQFTIDDIQWGETKNMSGRADWTYLTFKCGNVW